MAFGMTLKQLAAIAAGKAGKAIDTVGRATQNFSTVNRGFKLPELRISERLENIGGNAKKYNPFSPPSAKASGDVLGTTNYNGLSSDLSKYSFGQPINPTSGGSGGGITGGTTDGGGTGGDTGGTYDPFAQLRQAYDYAKGVYEQQFPGLESDYTRIKGDIEGAVNRAKQTLGEQKEDIGRGYGENLRNLLMNSQELGQKTRNIYSGLNALDSSSYGDAQIKQEQAQYDTQGKLDLEKTRSLKEADRNYSEYESKANSDLAELGKQYLAGKQALQQAIADNNIEEANSILTHMQNLGSLISNAKLNLASLQAQGTNVVGALKELNRGGVDSIFGNYLSNTYNPSMASLSYSTPQIQGNGYISPRTGKRYGSYQDYLRSEGA